MGVITPIRLIGTVPYICVHCMANITLFFKFANYVN